MALLVDRVRLVAASRREYLRRILSNDHIRFQRYFTDNYVEAEHFLLVADVLRRVEIGEFQNVVINIPPRYGKTKEVIIDWVARSIARDPRCRFLHLSYSDDLALDNSSQAKELILSDDYQELWPVRLKDDAQSKKKWYTSEGGGMYATSAGGQITGFGAGQLDVEVFCGAIIIDDPLKPDDAGTGEMHRINRRLNNTIKSRRNNRHVPIIIVMQRIHEDDMSGFVLGGGMGEEFYHLKLPAIRDDGTPLWPYKHTLEELYAERAADPYTFSGQMMQEPCPEDGEFFKREWFEPHRYRVGDHPRLLTMYGAGDFAVSGDRGDYTELGICGFDPKDDLWMFDWWSGQTEPDVWINKMIDLTEDHDPILWAAEKGVIKNAIEPFLKREMQHRGCYFRVEWMPSNKGKAANARGFQALASQGKVHIPLTPWGDALIAQLISFAPTADGKNRARHDDKVDVCGLFGRILDQTFAPMIPMPHIVQERDAWGWAEDVDDDMNWKTC